MQTHSSRRNFIRQSAVAAAGLMIVPGQAEVGPVESGLTAEQGGAALFPGGIGTLPQDRWPGRLVVGGKTLDDFVAISEEAHQDATWKVRVFQSSLMPTLQIRSQWRNIGPATEYLSTLVNTSQAPSARVTEVRSLAATWAVSGAVDFYGSKGGYDYILDEYADQIKFDLTAVELEPEGGRSSAGVLPFFALTDRQDALAIAIGWSGQWCASIRNTSGRLRLEVGLPRVGFVLHPGESARLPSILLTRVSQAPLDHARRALRAHMTKYVIPKGKDGASPNFTAHAPVSEYIVFGHPNNEAKELATLERAAKLGFETHWLDAGWYGNDPDPDLDIDLTKELANWDREAGNWYPLRSAFPRGLRPLSDRAHELGMKFLFWIDTERARPGTDWVRRHPEFFLDYPDKTSPDPYTRRGLLLNLGDPRAVDFAFKEVSALIRDFNADVLRNDFNMAPLDAWRAADTPDRIGMTEIKHIEGLYQLWDRLLAAFPGLLIDNCASGGRRIDLETMRRSIPLWRSDLGLFPGPFERADVHAQRQCYGIGHWISEHSGPIDTFDAYAVRSALATGFMAERPLPEDENSLEYANAKAAVAENKRLRPIVASERIVLIPPSVHREMWAAFQYHHDADARGIIVALCGPRANTNSVTLKPEYIDANATYELTRWNEYRAMAPVRIPGAKLKETVITITDTPGSVLIEYQRVG